MIRKALRYALTISKNPIEIKKTVEEYLAAAGYDRRYKFKWCAVSSNTNSGIFEYAGQRYYFYKRSGRLELERV